MKHCLLVIAAALAAFLVILGTWHLAYVEGAHHAIYDGTYYITEYSTDGGPADTIIHIELDDETYHRPMYIC